LVELSINVSLSLTECGAVGVWMWCSGGLRAGCTNAI